MSADNAGIRNIHLCRAWTPNVPFGSIEASPTPAGPGKTPIPGTQFRGQCIDLFLPEISDEEISKLSPELLQVLEGLGAVLGEVDADLVHDLDQEGIDLERPEISDEKISKLSPELRASRARAGGVAGRPVNSTTIQARPR